VRVDLNELARTPGHAFTKVDQPILVPGGHRISQLSKLYGKRLQLLAKRRFTHQTFSPVLERVVNMGGLLPR
jgi:hypothetical protein